MADINFEQMLAKYNQDYADARTFNSIMPDDGNYIVSVLKFEIGYGKEDVPWYKLIGRVEDPQDVKWGGHEFDMGFWGPNTFGFMKAEAESLARRKTNDLRDDLEVLQTSPGSVVNVEIKTTTSKANGKDYTNCYIREVINEVQTDREEPAPPQDVDAVTSE